MRSNLSHSAVLVASSLLVFTLLCAAPVSAQLVIFEATGITLGDDPVECTDHGTYRSCASDAGTERVLSHSGLDPIERAPIDFQLLLPPEPAVGPDGGYPLIFFLHGWGGNRGQIGGGLDGDMIPYAEAGYATLAYSSRGFGNSCGSSQQANPECLSVWTHAGDIRYEPRDAQYLAGLLADELSDTGDPLIDPQRIGSTGTSYGGIQSTMLAALRNRVVNLDGTTSPWTSPLGKPMQLAAAGPQWAGTDLGYALSPNGRTLDYVRHAPYRGPFGTNPLGIIKTTYNAGLYALGQATAIYAPPGGDPDLNTWNVITNAGEPYLEATAGAIIDAFIDWRGGYYWIDSSIEPAPILFNQGWSDDLFPLNEPMRFINRVKDLHGEDFPAKLVGSDHGHARATQNDSGYSRARIRAWFDHWIMGIGPEPGPDARVRTQECADGAPATEFSAPSWHELSAGEVRLSSPEGGIVLSTAGASPAASLAFDPIGSGDACIRVPDLPVAGAISYDFPAPDPGGYWVMGSPTVIADMTVVGTESANSTLAARLLDVDPDGNEQLLARSAYRPDETGLQVFQLSPMGFHVEDGHHLQLELSGHDAPTHRQSNIFHAVILTDVELRIPVVEAPDGGQIQEKAPFVIPAGYLPEPGATLGFVLGGALLGWLGSRRRRE